MVSVIVTAYNVSNYIEACLVSISNQTVSDIEIIIIDDGSSDNTFEICRNYQVNDERVRLIRTHRRGVSAARLCGVEHSNGEWIMFVDGDDELPCYSIETLLNLCDTKREIIGGTVALNAKVILKSENEKVILSPEDYITLLLKSEIYIGCCAKLIHRRLFNKIPLISQNITQNEDLLLMVQLTNKTQHIYILSQLPVYWYNRRYKSMSQSSQMTSAWLELFKGLRTVIESYGNLKMNEAYAMFMLHRLYHFCIQRGFFIDSHENTISEILLYTESFRLPKEYRKMQYCIKKKYVQYLQRINYLILNFAKITGRKVVYQCLFLSKEHILKKIY